MKKYMFLFFCILFVDQALSREAIDKQDWIYFSEKYVNLDKIVINSASSGSKTFSDDYKNREKAKFNLINSEKPSSLDLEKFIKSNNECKIQIALANIMINNIYERKLFDIIYKNYNFNIDFITKHYISQTFENLDDNNFKFHEKYFISIISSESNESIIMSLMPNLLKTNKDKAIFFLTKFLKSKNIGIKRAAYVDSKKMDDTSFKEIQRLLEKEGEIEALEFIRQ